ncbi:OmpA family protein [Hahella chejuensis]|uniref:OmpA family protein n=1 Tax=Hahella chejuensis TaxID=158327 RepID=UPI000A0180FC
MGITSPVYLLADDSVSIELIGHTDQRGENDANQRLAQARAKAVAAFLAQGAHPYLGRGRRTDICCRTLSISVRQCSIVHQRSVAACVPPYGFIPLP